MTAQLSEIEAVELHDKLRHQVGEAARAARTMADAAQVADEVAVLKRHRPRTYDVIGSADADGSNFTEHGFLTADGCFVGTEAALVLCEAHDDLTPWPCGRVSDLVSRLTGDPADTDARPVTA